jgi:hypothetical protein
MPGSNSETQRKICGSFGSNTSIIVQYSVGPIITLHSFITAVVYLDVDKYGNQVHPMIQMIFLNNDAVFQDNNAPIHTAGTVLSWFEEHEGEF